MSVIHVTQEQLEEAASLINFAIENHATAVYHTGWGVLHYVLEILDIQVER